MPVKIIAIPCSSAATITSSSLIAARLNDRLSAGRGRGVHWLVKRGS